MAKYVRFGTAASLFEVGQGWSFAGHISNISSTGFALTFGDGSTARFAGTGIQWNALQGKFVGGTIASITHDSAGEFNDSLGDLDRSAESLRVLFQTAASTDEIRVAVFSGDDVLDGRERLGGDLGGVRLIGFAGDDKIFGSDGGDLLGGENGLDTIYGRGGTDRIYGGNGDDVLSGGDGNDTIIAGGGNDTMAGGAGRDILHGTAGSDTYSGGAGTDTAVYTRSFFDLGIEASGKGWTVTEPNGADTLIAIERIAADEGTFVFKAKSGTWTQINDTPGELLLNSGVMRDGSEDADVIELEGTGDTIARGLGGDDQITGTSGYDLLMGGAGDDTINGDPSTSSGNIDRLYGGDGNDKLQGGGGGDLIYGGAGRDRIGGGNGSDELTGGGGKDVFEFVWDGGAGSPRTWGFDVIRDFTLGEDTIRLAFRNLPEGTVITPVLSQAGADALITLEGAGSIRLTGISIEGHTLEDFLV